ncbi:hypothetical protein Vretimale_14328, partial [Volvox reticuliferus]
PAIAALGAAAASLPTFCWPLWPPLSAADATEAPPPPTVCCPPPPPPLEPAASPDGCDCACGGPPPKAEAPPCTPPPPGPDPAPCPACCGREILSLGPPAGWTILAAASLDAVAPLGGGPGAMAAALG